MYSELEEYFNIDTEDMTKNQIIETIEDSISKKIQEETDFFKFLSLYGILSLIKTEKICPSLYYNEIYEKIYLYFFGYLNNDKENLNNNNFEEIFQKIFIDYSDENFYDFSQKIFVNNSNEKILFSLTCLISINTSLFLIYLCIVALNFKIRTIYEYDSEIDNNKENSFDLFQKFYSAFFTKLLCPLEKDKVLKISFANNNFDSEKKQQMKF